MSYIFRSFFVFILIYTYLGTGTLAHAETQPDLEDLPDTLAQQGDAFVEVWLSFRHRLDSLARMEVHPALLNHWFDAMPGFLARDAARLATDPAVLLAAKRRLKTIEGEAPGNSIDPSRRALRRYFPHHYTVFEAREHAARRFEIDDGIYAIWLQVMEEAVDLGARTSPQVIATIKTEMSDSSKSDEVRRRYLKSLVEFWKQVDRRISNTASKPTWPKNFDEGLKSVRALDQYRVLSPKDIEIGVSAAVALCTALGRALGYDSLSSSTNGVTLLSPGAGRAFDGNLATSWHVLEGTILTLLIDTEKSLRGLYFANFCPQGKRTVLRVVKVTGRQGDSTWKKEIRLSHSTKYFEFAELVNKTADRLELEFLDIEGTGPSCIAEIRIDLE